MFCLIYRSVAKPTFKEEDIVEMLLKARRNNEAIGITGCLLYYNGEFIQYLEGNQIKVLELFDRIREDKRHSDIELLSFAQLDEREFPRWEMAYEDLTGENDQITYIRLLINTYFEDPEGTTVLKPSSVPFWQTVRKLLNSRPGAEVPR